MLCGCDARYDERVTRLPDRTKEVAHSTPIWAEIGQLSALMLQLALLLGVNHLFTAESRAFNRIFALGLLALPLHHFLPLRRRMPFFALLSLVGIALVLGAVNSAWLVGIGALLVIRAIFEWEKSLVDLAFIATGLPFALFWVRKRKNTALNN